MLKRSAIRFLLILIPFFFSCKKTLAPLPVVAPQLATLSLDKSVATLKMGQHIILKPALNGNASNIKNCKWYDLDPGILDLKVNEDNSLTVIGKGIGETFIRITDTVKKISTDCKVSVVVGSVRKWVAFGNSITKHPLTDFWWGQWGMAATVKENDYVHVLSRALNVRAKGEVTFDAVNIAAWERDFKGFDKAIISNSLKGDEDLVIIRLGENVPINNEAYAIYESELTKLLLFLKEKAPQATFMITGNFWTNADKDLIQKKVAKDNYCIWVPLNQLDKLENKSTLTTLVYGDDNKFRPISDAGNVASGVADHPGDEGMANIARAIMAGIDGRNSF